MYHSTYRGYSIYIAGTNSSGIRYYTMPQNYRADTLAGLKQLIKDMRA
jgi:hypothetical protein